MESTLAIPKRVNRITQVFSLVNKQPKGVQTKLWEEIYEFVKHRLGLP